MCFSCLSLFFEAMESKNPFEETRLQTLAQLALLDTPPEKEYDDLVDLAARLCEVPVSLISFVAEDRQWFKARTGLHIQQTHRSLSFCDHALRQNNIFLIKDATQDERFANSPLVIGEPYIRFYAGVPVVAANGCKLGTLCIIDSRPRELSWEQASVLKTLAAQVSKLLALRQAHNTINSLQAEVQEKKERITRLKTEKHRKTELSQAAMENAALFLNEELQVLKTGKFTKKELSALSCKAGSLAVQLQLFRQGLALLSQWRSEEKKKPDQLLCVNTLLSEIQNEMADALKSASIRLNTFVSNQLMITLQREALYVVIKILLQAIISVLNKTELRFEVIEKEDCVEMRISVHDQDIRKAIWKMLPDEAETGFTLPFAMANEIVEEAGGSLSVWQHGHQGGTVTLHLPLPSFD